MFKKLVRILGGDPNQRQIDQYAQIVEEINALEPRFEKMSRDELSAQTAQLKLRLANGETLDDVLPEAFAAVREASKRTLGLRHYDVQMIGGIALHQGKIAEMRTGEGKTLVATLPLYLNALTGRGVHLVTVNDYLARRDARWMAPIYNLLGLSVGVLQMAARTENGKQAFIVDLERESPHEDQHQLRMVPRREAYEADITYGTNSEFGFDYLRDNMTMRLEDRVQRGHFYAIIDEVDNVLIDEARTPLIISGPAQDEAEWYERMAQVVKALHPEDYEIGEKERSISLTEIGEAHVEELLGMALRDPDRPEDITLEQARMLGYLEQALRAQYLFRKNKDYLVQGGKVIIIDEFTGRLMPGRRWSDGLHQAVEAKEGVKVQSESVTYATITIQNYFRMYEKLSGMTGTAMTEAEEFDKIYKLDVLAIPTNLEYLATRPDSTLELLEARDEQGYKYSYYADRNDPERKPIFWKRKDYPDVVYRTEEAKLRAIALEILRYHALGRPILVGTTSVELSERVSARLRAEPLRRLVQVALLRDAWFEKNNREEDGRQVPELQFMNGPLNSLNVNDMRKLARDLDLSFNPTEENNLTRLERLLGLPESVRDRLVAAVEGGIPHQVLNARKHTEESQIIAGAGAFGAVTIATNMAGRGVDIKLGGELAEEILSAVNRVIGRGDSVDPYAMSMEERRDALLAMGPEAWGIYQTEVQYFLKYMEEMERVRELGGLHVIGSERHEARRIDNQLRGRAARQGDPGSSRFYLSMEDELMRLFGGQQADALMQRLKIDDALPLEVGLVGRLVEQSQTRVEGANFDVRKHLLEYDDVLNTQRAKIYAQRNIIFQKEDLSEDVREMLRTEITRRVPEALADEGGPWKLLAWLDQIQPPLVIHGQVIPSYALRLLADDVLNDQETISPEDALENLLDLARDSIEAERSHLLQTVNNLLNQTEDRLTTQLQERLDAVDTFFEGLELEDEESGGDSRKPAELAAELSAAVRLSLRLSTEQQRQLRDNPSAVREEIDQLVEQTLTYQAVLRLVGAVERRLEESLDLDVDKLPVDDWDALARLVLDAVEESYNRRLTRLLGDDGQIRRELQTAISRIEGPIGLQAVLHLLTILPQGTRTTFDRKTHRRVLKRTTRLVYTYHAAQLLTQGTPEEIAAEVLEHLEKAQEAMQQGWGQAEITRLGDATMASLDETVQRSLRRELSEATYARLENRPLRSLEEAEREKVIAVLGRLALTEIYRQLLLRVISELWIDYLTQMEALRVSIGLEAYGQRDPLVQYKNKAFGLFQDLLNNMRLGVVTRMFTYKPRDLTAVQAAVARPDGGTPAEEVAEQPAAARPTQEAVAEGAGKQGPAAPKESGSKKRRRRRR